MVVAWDGDGFSICIGFFRKRRFSKNYVNQAMISISIGWSGHVFCCYTWWFLCRHLSLITRFEGLFFNVFCHFTSLICFLYYGGLLMDEAYDIILKITADGQRRFSMRLTQEAIMELERNPYVIRSGPDRITYSREFKHHFMREYLSGKKPT